MGAWLALCYLQQQFVFTSFASHEAPLSPALSLAPHRFAVKSMPKRFAGDGTLESYYVRRVRNEVDICNHLGRWGHFGTGTRACVPPSCGWSSIGARHLCTCAAQLRLVERGAVRTQLGRRSGVCAGQGRLRAVENRAGALADGCNGRTECFVPVLAGRSMCAACAKRFQDNRLHAAILCQHELHVHVHVQVAECVLSI